MLIHMTTLQECINAISAQDAVFMDGLLAAICKKQGQLTLYL